MYISLSYHLNEKTVLNGLLCIKFLSRCAFAFSSAQQLMSITPCDKEANGRTVLDSSNKPLGLTLLLSSIPSQLRPQENRKLT